MSFKIVQSLPSPEEIEKMMPITQELRELKAKRDREIKKIFTGESDLFILIIGLCSANDEKAVIEYVKKLGKLQKEFQDKLMIIPRIYTNKPRTTGEGYKGYRIIQKSRIC